MHFCFIAFRKTANEGELSKVKQLDANNRKTNKFKNKRFIIKVVFTVKLVVEQKSKEKTCNKKITVEEDRKIPLLAQILQFALLFSTIQLKSTHNFQYSPTPCLLSDKTTNYFYGITSNKP